MIDHICIRVTNYGKTKAFYEKALKPLGLKLNEEYEGTMGGFGADGKSFLWVIQGEPLTRATHVAFTSRDRKGVDQFYAAAIAAGGKDNGKPGPRPQYSENYYGAFVLDPDGNNIEAVCHKAK
ncbi:MAG TPA: VOC family protein [Bdellovibrionota bacterium]|nr:VOC family protein [Bdellovibrionota bacterium]